MWPFSSNTSYINSGVLRGATDWHSHILPGVDDGVQTLGESLSILRYYEECGIQHLWLTPHIMEDIPNTTAALRQRFAELQEAYLQDRESRAATSEAVNLHLAAENMLDGLFHDRFVSGDLLPIGEAGDTLLVETSYYNPPLDLWATIYSIMSAGYRVLLAHPERYFYANMDDYHRLREIGVLFQLNLSSLVGGYGPKSKAIAERLLKLDYYDFKGTDTHRDTQVRTTFECSRLKKSCPKLISKVQ